jgi:hypothetical protein
MNADNILLPGVCKHKLLISNTVLTVDHRKLSKPDRTPTYLLPDSGHFLYLAIFSQNILP